MRIWMPILCCLTMTAHANLGWYLEQQKQQYGVPSVDRQRRDGYPGLLFRHYFLHGTHIEVGIQNFNGKWRSVWESYQNFREVRDGYRDGRPVFKQEILPFSDKDLKRRLSANGGKTGWDSKAQGKSRASRGAQPWGNGHRKQPPA